MWRGTLFFVVLIGVPCTGAHSADDFAETLACYRRDFGEIDSFGTTTLEKIEGRWQIRGLDLYSGLPESLDASQLATLRHLNTLRLSEISPAIVCCLSELPDLRRLEVWNRVTEEELDAICKLRQLTHLAFPIWNFYKQHGKGLSGLAELRNLRTLELSAAGIDDKSVDFLVPLTALLELRLIHNERLTDLAVTKLRSLKGLRILTVDTLGESGLSVLENLPRLEQLEIYEYGPGPTKVICLG